jgi:hypothetical protein
MKMFLISIIQSFKYCFCGQALTDWILITSVRSATDCKDLRNFSEDSIDAFIKHCESHIIDEEDLLLQQGQLSSVSKLHKPLKTLPTTSSKFHNQWLNLNHLISVISINSNTPDDQFCLSKKLKYLFLYSMPPIWKTEFKNIGEKKMHNAQSRETCAYDLCRGQDAR